MRTFVLSTLLLAFVSSSAYGSDGRLREWLGSGSWAEGVEYCNGKLIDDLSRRPNLVSVTAEHLSRLATYCAALASGKGDPISSGWWWYTAASLDLKTAQGLLPELRKMGLLQTLPAPRTRVTSGSREPKEDKHVRLPSGETVPGTPPRVVLKPKPPEAMFRPVSGVGSVQVAIEVELVVSRDGVPQQPLLVKARALPVHVLMAYHFFSTWRLEPAKVNGEPVESILTLTVNTRYVD